jgi:hypothetical protein
MIHSDGTVRASADWITTLDAERGNKQAGGKFGVKESPQIKTTSENSQGR